MSKGKAGALALVAMLLMAMVPAADGKKRQSKAPKSVPGKEIASALKSGLPRSVGVKVSKATCPKKIRNRKKQTATCKVYFVSGDTVRVRITLQNTNGTFKQKLMDVLTRHLEGQLEDSIQNFKARVVCPKTRAIKKADTFTCDIYKAAERNLVGFYDLTQVGDGRIKPSQPRSATPESKPVNPVPADLGSQG